MVARRPVGVALLSATLAALSVVARSETAPPSGAGVLVSRQLMAAQQLRVGDLVSLSAEPDGSQPRSFLIVDNQNLRIAHDSFGENYHPLSPALDGHLK